jgi:dienelactone hydrolase
MHLGEEDELISKAAQAQIKAALAGKASATVYSYPGQRHAFARHNGALQCRGGCARQWADKRISTSTTAVTHDRCSHFGRTGVNYSQP